MRFSWCVHAVRRGRMERSLWPGHFRNLNQPNGNWHWLQRWRMIAMPVSVGLCIWSILLQSGGGRVFERAEARRENGEMAWRRLRRNIDLRLHFSKFGGRAERFC